MRSSAWLWDRWREEAASRPPAAHLQGPRTCWEQMVTFRSVTVRWQPDPGQGLPLHLSSAYKRLKLKALCKPVRSSLGSPGGSVVKSPPAKSGDVGSIPLSGRSSRGGHGCPLQYSCLENPHGQKSLAGYVHGVSKSQTQLNNSNNKSKPCALGKLKDGYPDPCFPEIRLPPLLLGCRGPKWSWLAQSQAVTSSAQFLSHPLLFRILLPGD